MKWQMQKCKLKMKVGDCKINTFQVRKRYFFFMFYLHKLEGFSYEAIEECFHNI